MMFYTFSYIYIESFTYIGNANKNTLILFIVTLLFLFQEYSRNNNKIKYFVIIYDGGCMKRTMSSWSVSLVIVTQDNISSLLSQHVEQHTHVIKMQLLWFGKRLDIHHFLFFRYESPWCIHKKLVNVHTLLASNLKGNWRWWNSISKERQWVTIWNPWKLCEKKPRNFFKKNSFYLITCLHYIVWVDILYNIKAQSLYLFTSHTLTPWLEASA